MTNGYVTVYHYNDTVDRDALSFDNDQRHVTAFRPISEAAHSRSYDNETCRSIRNENAFLRRDQKQSYFISVIS